MLAGAVPSEGLTRAAVPASRLAHTTEVGTGLSSCHLDLFVGLFQCPQDLAASYPRLSHPRKSKEDAAVPFMPW